MIDWIKYDPAAPSPSYFTVGQLISVLALLFAFSQLTKPIIKFRIRVHRVRIRTLYALGITSIASVFLAMSLPFIPGPALPFISYPVFWEALAGIILVTLGIYLVYAITTPPVFNRKNAKSYLDECATILATGNQDDLSDLAKEISASIDSVFKYSRFYTPNTNLTSDISVSVLSLWSDVELCTQIATRSPFTALQAFREASKPNNGYAVGYAFITEIIHQSFLNQNSLLMREKNYSGFGFYNTFRDSIFGVWEFVEGPHRPLQAWSIHDGATQPWQIEKYCECLETAYKAYFQNQVDAAYPFLTSPSALFSGTTRLSEIAETQTRWMQDIDNSAIRRNPEFTVLFCIERGLIRIFNYIDENDSLIPEQPFDANTYLATGTRMGDHSVYGIFAYSVYKYFESLSMSYRHDDGIRGCAISLWLTILGAGDGPLSRTQNEVGKRLIIHLNEKLDDNFSHKRPYYPLVARLLIALNGLSEPKEDSTENIRKIFHRSFMKRLKEYPRLVSNDPKFAADMLPENCIYDADKYELRYSPNRMRNDVLTLKPDAS